MSRNPEFYDPASLNELPPKPAAENLLVDVAKLGEYDLEQLLAKLNDAPFSDEVVAQKARVVERLKAVLQASIDRLQGDIDRKINTDKHWHEEEIPRHIETMQKRLEELERLN